MDPITAFAIATLMMMLNGAVLGLIHRDLPESLRPAATSWRFGTLLMAGGCVLLAVQHELPAGFVLPAANGMLFLGLTAYWRALRQFDGWPDHPLILLPFVLGTVGVAWFAIVDPRLDRRVLISSIAWTIMFVSSAHILYAGRRRDNAMSRRVLFVIFVTLALFMLVRAGYFALSADLVTDILDGRSWMNMATPLMASVLPVVGTTAFLLMCSERIRRQWEHAASTDALTGLANRRTLTRVGAERLPRARAQRDPFALAIVDIDHFKSINDRFGHDIGDLALRHVADALAKAAAASALPGRQGGEEFVVLLAADRDQAQQQAEHLREAVRSARFRSGEQEVAITVSIGVTSTTANDDCLDDLLRRADQALYAAKSGGRDCVVLA